MPEAPKLKPQKPGSTNQKPPNSSLKSVSNARNIPLMFQAQIKERGNIQYVGDQDQPKYRKWVDEWVDGCPSQPEVEDTSIPLALRRPVQSMVSFPQFDSTIKTYSYQIRWRILTNSGQDEALIRPIIGAKGIPFFPGSGMKGAFRKACPKEKQIRYCGGDFIDERGNKRTTPGILRFHGGYPIDMTWAADRNRLVDLAHGQQAYQVMKDKKEKGDNANVQISLYKPKFKFGISSAVIPTDSQEWKEIKQIWEKALGYGLGSRVSASYGYVEEVNYSDDRTLLSIYLNGKGVSSQLLSKTPEFRPNMFKATLRGHTLRILGGLIDARTAIDLTNKIWGGIPERGEGGEATVGSIGVEFSLDDDEYLQLDEHIYYSEARKKIVVPLYDLNYGKLKLIRISNVKPELENFLISLIKFSVLFGGFGKSWRRVNHQEFYPSYFENDNKPMIGCHWSLTSASQDFLVYPEPNLEGITNFIETIRTQAIAWIISEMGTYQSKHVREWREAWHPSKVQIWGRVTDKKKSIAILWFHGNYQDEKTIKKSILTGEIGKIGRIWHRMYPVENHFVELLTIFPDDSQQTKDFLDFLSSDHSKFKLIWGGEKS
jgi:CRISPR-associated protein Cmr6